MIVFTIVYENGKRVLFSNGSLLLNYLLLECPKMQLRTFALIRDWVNNVDDTLPFCWVSFYITKE